MLADIRSRGMDTIYCLGDLVDKEPDSCEVADICRDAREETARSDWHEDILYLIQ